VSLEPPAPTGDLVAVAELRDGVRAGLCRMSLEACGIQAWLPTRHLGGVAPHLGIAVGLEVRVRSSEAEAARNELAAGAAALSHEGTLCPRCGSPRFQFLGRPARARALLGYFVFGIPRPDVRWRWYCRACGKEWK
jgi:hypothetical protein